MKYTDVQTLRKKAARYPLFDPETEATSAAVLLAAGTLGGMTVNAIKPTRDKGKSLIKRLMTGAGKGALAGVGAAVGSSLGRNGVAYAINEGWI